ncbi:MAG: hypothetical protein CMJ82_01025 [Planctomycetaceae bacterium]|mgnify:FL=1|nr:hypothetical protein [Planctomycetaceae bacterium]
MSSKERKKKNPFYTLLIWVGILFAVTATSYGVMTVSFLRASEEITEASGPEDNYHPLFHFLDENGFDLMLAELGMLGVLTFAAIAYDEVHDVEGVKTNEVAESKLEGQSVETSDATGEQGLGEDSVKNT